MAFTDSHAHLCSNQFAADWQEIVASAQQAGVSTIINISDNLQEAEVALDQAAKLPIVFTTIGIQPECTADLPTDWLNNVRRLIASSSKVVGIGEIGLDTTIDQPIDQQLSIFQQQIQLAADLNLPIVIHTRDPRDQQPSPSAFDQIITTLTHYPTLTGVFHCWTGTPDQAKQALDLGFYLSFSGIITYPTAGHILDVVRLCPADRLLLETDTPYLLPEPLRAQLRRTSRLNRQPSSPHLPDSSKLTSLANSPEPSRSASWRIEPSTVDLRCKPEYVTITGKKLADVRQVPLDTIAAQTTRNAKTLFNLPDA